MKKILFFISAASLALSSCTREVWQEVPVADGDGNTLRLGVRCLTRDAVKSATETGLDQYNENSVYHIDWFIYNENSESAEAVSHARITYTGEENGFIVPVDETTAREYLESISLDDLVDEGKLAAGGKGYVFVIANLPDPYTHGEDGITADGGTFATSMADLKALAVDASFVTTPTDGNFNINGYVNTDNHFVMVSSAAEEFTLQEKTPSQVIAPLKRIASKIQLKVNIIDEVVETNTTTGKKIKRWESKPEKVQIYMLNTIRHATLDGQVRSYEDADAETDSKTGWFFNSPRYALNATFDDNGKVTAQGTSAGTVFNTGEYSLVGTPFQKGMSSYERSRMKDEEGNELWYALDGDGKKIVLTDENGEQYWQTTTEDTGDENQAWEWTNVVKPADLTPVKSVPFYSYPLTWNTADAHAPFIKIILPWQGYAIADDGVTETPDAKETEFYYKLTLPNFQYGGSDSGYELRGNYCYNISLDLSVLGSGADDVPVDVFGNYYVVDWSKDPAGMGGDLDSGRYLEVPQDSYSMYGNELEISLKSSHEITFESVTTSYPVYNTSFTDHVTGSGTNRHGYLEDYNTTTDTGYDFILTATDRNTVKLYHVPETDLSKLKPKDVAPITYTFYIKQVGTTGDELKSQLITVTQYPQLYIKTETSNKYIYINGTSNRFTNNNYKTVYETGFSSSDYRLGTIRSYNYSVPDNNNENIYTVCVTVLDNENWTIGDPRVKTGVEYSNLKGTYTSGESLKNYKKVNQTSSGFIAPVLKIASSFGASFSDNSGSGRISYDYANRRCAAYQENGYPAGRWRIPTDAEIRFIIQLSDLSLIPSLFKGNYWAGSGKPISDSGEYIENPGQNYSVRCVYDSWYWGDAPIDSYKEAWSSWQSE